MKTFLIRTVLCCALLFASLLNSAGVANAAPCANPSTQLAACVLDQQQLAIVGVPSVLGGPVVRGQTFVPAARTRICRVSVKIAKNHSQAGNLRLDIVLNNFAPVQAAIIPAGAIPFGPSWQTFNFGCSGPRLPSAPFYGLKLSSPTSAPGAYSWFHGPNEAAYPGGQGWVNAGAGWAPAGHDYVFKIYTCR